MKNKKVIRKQLVKNQFTSIHTSILNDTRLTSNAFRLLTSILSDNDETFNLSQTVYCNRLGWDNKMFQRAIDNLIECGYIKRTEISNDKYIPGVKKAGSTKKVYFYTVSEYGNLNTEKKLEEPITQVEENDTNNENSVLTESEVTTILRRNLGSLKTKKAKTEYINEMMDILNEGNNGNIWTTMTFKNKAAQISTKHVKRIQQNEYSD